MARRKFAPLPGSGYLLLVFSDYEMKQTLMKRFYAQSDLFNEIRDLKLAIKARSLMLLEDGTEGVDYSIYSSTMDKVGEMRVYGLSKPNVVATTEEGEIVDNGELAEPERRKPGRKSRVNRDDAQGVNESV